MNANAAKPIDIEDLKKLRRMGRKMVALYGDLDPKVKKASSALNISCKAGCSGCCYLLTLVTLPEGIAIAEYFLEDKQRRQLIPMLMRSFLDQIQATPSGLVRELREKYFAAKIPCTFLDPETKLCTIYPVRPAACRYHLVSSDPSLCQPEAGQQEVARVDTRQADMMVLAEAAHASNLSKVPLFVAPLPVTMLWAFKLLIEGREAFEIALKEDQMGALHLGFWHGLFNPVPQPEVMAAQQDPQPGETPATGSD